MTALAVSAISMSGCGMGKKLVKSLDFVAGDEGGHLVAGFDAKVEMGMGTLPDIKLPIYDPKSPSRFLGYIETHYDGGISVRIDVTTAAKIKVTDGTLLPNGREIPVLLPAGVIPVAIPVINSNSKVYLAVGSQNIMAGVAVTLLTDTGKPSSNSDWLKFLQQLPSNIFFPFQIAPDLKGTGGVFTGEKVGVGLFAVKTLGAGAPKPISFQGGEFSNTTLTAARIQGTPQTVSTEVFGIKTQYPTGNKMYKLGRALREVRDTQLD